MLLDHCLFERVKARNSVNAVPVNLKFCGVNEEDLARVLHVLAKRECVVSDTPVVLLALTGDNDMTEAVRRDDRDRDVMTYQRSRVR